MKDKTRERVALGLGLMAGAALGFFLNSDKGREVRKDVNEKALKLGEEASERISHYTEEAKEKADAFSTSISHAVEEGKEYLTHVGENLKKKLVCIANEYLIKNVPSLVHFVHEETSIGETENEWIVWAGLNLLQATVFPILHRA